MIAINSTASAMANFLNSPPTKLSSSTRDKRISVRKIFVKQKVYPVSQDIHPCEQKCELKRFSGPGLERVPQSTPFTSVGTYVTADIPLIDEDQPDDWRRSEPRKIPTKPTVVAVKPKDAKKPSVDSSSKLTSKQIRPVSNISRKREKTFDGFPIYLVIQTGAPIQPD